MFGKYHESFALLSSELVLPIEKIADSGYILSSYASTDLMELSETKLFGIRYDDRIGSEEVHSIFYDSRREEDIILSPLEGEYTIFDSVRRHLSMCDDYRWRIDWEEFHDITCDHVE